MKITKRIAALALAVLTALSLAACGAPGQENAETAAETQTAPQGETSDDHFFDARVFPE